MKPAQRELGRKLFFEKNLSGNRKISCSSCHQPTQGTGDALALSLGESVIRRNSPPLYNLSENDFERPLFWDGRVHYNPDLQKLVGPLDEDTEIVASKEYKAILGALSSPLAMQALFPLISREEMLGKKGENELADAGKPLSVWKGILDRILSMNSYQALIRMAYPGVALSDINIGHLASAVAHFITYEFSATNTPYDRYLRGDKQALSEREKKGFKVFLGPGGCVSCHNGRALLPLRRFHQK